MAAAEDHASDLQAQHSHQQCVCFEKRLLLLLSLLQHHDVSPTAAHIAHKPPTSKAAILRGKVYEVMNMRVAAVPDDPVQVDESGEPLPSQHMAAFASAKASRTLEYCGVRCRMPRAPPELTQWAAGCVCGSRSRLRETWAGSVWAM